MGSVDIGDPAMYVKMFWDSRGLMKVSGGVLSNGAMYGSMTYSADQWDLGKKVCG